ncbi:YbaB/EbfC family nucleoid-associated protein [Glycomyces sp. NPDC049804]|uniref:YbaB/EbfC family nucleoid-associated protein n=1 Tax=Glycomyces sp. NPDC049804 TaxID=3154363 RepID=UPI003425FA34
MLNNEPSDLADRSARLQRAITEIEADVVAEDGAIRVIVGAGGRIRKIDLGLQAFEFSAAELGPIVAETIRAAERSVDVKAQEIVRSMLGEQFVRSAAKDEKDNA